MVQRLVGDHQHRLQRRPQVGGHARGSPARRSPSAPPLGLDTSSVGDAAGRRPRRSAPSPSNSSVISTSPSSAPVQRTVSSPSGVTWSKATAPSRNSSSSARNRATVVSVSGGVAAQRPERHRALPAQPVDDQRRLLADADRRGVQVGQRHLRAPAWAPAPARPARRTPRARARSAPRAAASRSAPRARPPAGSAAPPRRSRSSSTEATCLNARYCSSRANSRSRASSSARSSSSSTSACGSSRAALRSSRVAATSRNDEVCSRSHVLAAARLDVGDELVGDPGQRHLGDVELVLGDQAEQQVERALEVVQPQRRSRALAAGPRSTSATGSVIGGPRRRGGHAAQARAARCPRRARRGRPAPSRPRPAPGGRGRRRARRAPQLEPGLLEVEQLVGGDVDGHLLVVLDPAARPRGWADCGRPRRRLSSAASRPGAGTTVGRNSSSAAGRLTRRGTEPAPPWPAGGRPRAPGGGAGVRRDRLAGHRGVGELHGAADDGVEDVVAPGLHQPLHHLAAVQGAAVVHRAEHAVDLQPRVEPLGDLVDRGLEQRDAAQREVLALQRHDHAVRRR